MNSFIYKWIHAFTFLKTLFKTEKILISLTFFMNNIEENILPCSTVETEVNGAMEISQWADTRIRWQSTWSARWSGIHVASESTGCVASPQKNTVILYTDTSTKKRPSVLRSSVCTMSAVWYPFFIPSGLINSIGSSPPCFFMLGTWNII